MEPLRIINQRNDFPWAPQNLVCTSMSVFTAGSSADGTLFPKAMVEPMLMVNLSTWWRNSPGLSSKS